MLDIVFDFSEEKRKEEATYRFLIIYFQFVFCVGTGPGLSGLQATDILY